MIQKVTGNKFKFFILLAIFLNLKSISLGASIYSDVSQVPMNNDFTLTVEFKNEDKKDYIIEGLENFQVISKQSYSKYNNINGKSSKIKSDIYKLLPIKEGSFDLHFKTTDNSSEDSISIEVNNEVNLSLPQGVSIEQSGYTKDYYFGEKIPYFENFVITISLADFKYQSLPKFSDFTMKNVTPRDHNKYITNSTTRDGREALEIKVFEGIIEPLSTGEKILHSGVISYVPSSQDFFASYNSKFVSGQEVKINILPLPLDSKPLNFNNLVGDFKPTITWTDKPEISLGDSLTLRVKLSGSANFDTLETLGFKNSQDFNIYESIISSSEGIKEGKYYADKVFELAFIPKKIGSFSTPEIEIPYFDTENKKYSSFTIPSKEVKVINPEGEVLPNKVEPSLTASSATEPQPKIDITPLEITTLPEREVVKTYNFYIIGSLIGVIFLQFLVILKLLFDKKPKTTGRNYFKMMKRARSDKDFYDIYCEYMKDKYKFSPKAHLDLILSQNGGSQELINLNSSIQENLFKNIPLDRKSIIKNLKDFS